MAHTLNTSRDRLAVAESWLTAHIDSIALLSRDAQVMAALGLLICDDEGRIKEADVTSAWADPSAVSAAQLLVTAVMNQCHG